MTDAKALRKAWEEHPRYRYRGCAPDVDEPRRAAGNLDLTLDAWSGADRDGSEPQKEREARQEAARDVCMGCAVMVQCEAYATSVVWVNGNPRLAEPEGVWGGLLALERHARLIKRQMASVAAPDRRFQTPQKRAALHALARCWDPFEVAAVASELLASWGEGPEGGMDVRTANWQRSSLVRLLGLPKDVTRMWALEAARGRGLLEGVPVVEDDGSVPAVPPPTRVTVPEPAPAAAAPVLESEPAVQPKQRRRARSSRRARSVMPNPVKVLPGQLSFDDAPAPAPVTRLFPNRRLEAAA